MGTQFTHSTPSSKLQIKISHVACQCLSALCGHLFLFNSSIQVLSVLSRHALVFQIAEGFQYRKRSAAGLDAFSELVYFLRFHVAE